MIENLSLARRGENKSLKDIYSCGSEEAAHAMRGCYKTLDFSGDYCTGCFLDDDDHFRWAIFRRRGSVAQDVCEGDLFCDAYAC